MYPKLITLLISLSLCLSSTLFQTESTTPQTLTLQINQPTMTYNGVVTEIDPGYKTAPIIMDGRTMVPIRAIIEQLGGTVDYDSLSKKITINMNGTIIELWAGKALATVNQLSVFSDPSPVIMNGRTLVPLRFVIEHLNGYTIDWNSLEQQITIRTAVDTPKQFYYLDALKGSDTLGNGTQAKPYQTIEKVWPLLQGGDTVLLASGNYSKIAGGRTGEEGKPWTQSPATIFDDWVTFKALDHQTPHIVSIDLGTWNESPGVALPFATKGSHNAYLRFDGLIIDDGVHIMGSKYVHINNCIIRQTGPINDSEEAINTSGVTVFNGKHITIENSEITHTAIGVMVMSTDFILRNNNIHNNSHDGMRIYGGENLLIEGNKIHDLDDGLSDDSGVKWNMHVDGIHIFFPTSGSKWASELKNLTIRGNLFYHIESMGIMVNASNPPQTRYQNFLFENNVMGPVGGNLLHWGARIDGFIYRHNTIVYTSKTTWQSMYRTLDCSKYTVAWWPDGDGKMVYNNLFVDSKSKPDGTDPSFALVSNNAYVQESWRSMDSNEFILDKLPYKDGDFTGTLIAGSGPINSGTSVDKNKQPLIDLLLFDIYNHPRDKQPDIGAYEVQSLGK